MNNSNMGSCFKTNPKPTFKWIWEPAQSRSTPKTLVSLERHETETLEPLEPNRSISGEMCKCGFIRVAFDQGLIHEIEAIARTLKERTGRPISQSERYGWGGQFAYDSYLNYFKPHCDFSVQHDNPHHSPKAKKFDFILTPFKGSPFTIEIKTAPPYRTTIQYCLYPQNPYPLYFVAIKALSFTQYDIYGFMTGVELSKLKSVIRYKGKKCHDVEVNRKFL
jgi:hypothetical protein